MSIFLHSKSIPWLFPDLDEFFSMTISRPVANLKVDGHLQLQKPFNFLGSPKFELHT